MIKYIFFLFPIFLQAQCLIPTHSYRLVCVDEVRYADSTSIGSRLYISSKNAFVTSPRSIFSLVNGYGQHFIQITNSANSQKVAINRAWINRIDSTSSNKALIYIKDISVTFTSVESYTAVKDSAIACFVRAVASGLATLSDGDYGDVVVSGGGLVMAVDKPDLGLHNLADGDFSVTGDSTALSLSNVRRISLLSKTIDGWLSRLLQENNQITLRTQNSTKVSRIFIDTTGANFQFVNGSNNASLRIGDSVAVRFNTSGSVGDVLTVTSIDGDGRLVINPKAGGGSLDSIATSSVTWAKLSTPVKDSIRLVRGVTSTRLADSTAAIRATFLVDTTITVENVTYSIEDSIDLSRFRKIVFVLKTTGSSSATLRVPEASLDFKSTTIYAMALDASSGTCGLLFVSDLNGFQLASTITDLETGVYSVSNNPLGGYMWIETKSANVDNDGIISALPLGDVDIDGAASSDLRIRGTRTQFEARMKIGADSSFIHDPTQDTTVIKGDIVLGKFCTVNTYPFSMRNSANSSTTLLIESGATTGFGALKLTSYSLPSKIEYGSTTSSYLNFYNTYNSRNGLQLGTITNPRTVLIGYTDSGTNWGSNGSLVVYDTISSGKGLVTFKKVASNSTPILTLSSVANDRFVFHDDGRAFFNNLGTGTATQTLGLTSSGQVVPYTQVLPTAHVSAIDAAVDISTQVNASINTYVSYYLTSGTSRTLTLPEPSSTLAGRSVIVSYTATDFGYTGVILNTPSATSEFWAMNPTTLAGTAATFSGLNVGRQSTSTWTCRQINGTYYWAQDFVYDPSSTYVADERKTGITGTTLTFTESVELGIFNDVKFSLYKNGLFLSPGVDYTVASTEPVTITLAVAAISSDVFFFNYK